MARPKKSAPFPSYRFHKASGKAVVTLAGKDHYLGVYNSPESRAEYDRLIAEYLVNGRRAPVQQDTAAPITVLEVADAYLLHIEKRFAPNDKPGRLTRETSSLRGALAPLRRLYGRTPAVDFGPLGLKVVREEFVKLGWCRGYINEQTARIVRAFKWAVSNEMIPAAALQALQTVPGLRRGKVQVREGRKVRPVADSTVEAILPHVSRQVKAMVELMGITGMRAGEVTIMRTGDIDTTGDLWEYRPAHHKGEHHGHERIVPLGPRAKKTVKPFLRPNLQEYIFSPAEADQERREALHAKRKTPLGYGNSPGTNRKRHPKRKPRERYDVTSLGRAIYRGCDKAFPVPAELANAPENEKPEDKTARLLKIREWRRSHRWHPHQLRHTAATRLRKQYGIEVARVILGHHSPAVTEIYAESDKKRALQVAAEVG